MPQYDELDAIPFRVSSSGYARVFAVPPEELWEVENIWIHNRSGGSATVEIVICHEHPNDVTDPSDSGITIHTATSLADDATSTAEFAKSTSTSPAIRSGGSLHVSGAAGVFLLCRINRKIEVTI